MHNVNLIPQYRAQRRRMRRRVRAWAWVCGVYGAALVMACATATAMGGRADRMTVQELARLNRQIGEASGQIALVTPELREAQAQLSASRSVTVQPDWGVLLKLLGASRGDKVVLDHVTLAPVERKEKKEKAKPKPAAGKRNIALGAAAKKKAEPEDVRKPLLVRLEFSGLAQSQLDVSEFVLRLEKLKLFDTVKLLDTNRGAVGGTPAVSFHVECWMNEASGMAAAVGGQNR